MGLAGIERVDNTVVLGNGRRLGYAEYGVPSGPAVFYFHGWPGSRFQGLRLDGAARALGVRVVAPERPGYGLSGMQVDRVMLDWPCDVVALADTLGIERFAVFGASGGGPYALACAAAIAERLTGVLVANGLAPFDAPGILQSYSPTQRLLLRAVPRVPGMLSAIMRLVAGRALSDPLGFLAGASHRLPAVDRAIVNRPDVRAMAALDIQAALQDGGRAAVRDALLLSQAWGFGVNDIQMPVHLWYGGSDTIVRPANGQYLERVIPCCYAHVDPRDGHYLMIPRAEEMLRVGVG